MKLTERQSIFLGKEKRRIFIFVTVMLFVKYAPSLFSLSGTSTQYEQYYASRVPISLPEILVILYVVRLLVLMVKYFLFKPKKAHRQPIEIFSDGY